MLSDFAQRKTNPNSEMRRSNEYYSAHSHRWFGSSRRTVTDRQTDRQSNERSVCNQSRCYCEATVKSADDQRNVTYELQVSLVVARVR